MLVLLGAGAGVFLLVAGSDPCGRFAEEPDACSLLRPQEIGAYVPGAVADPSGSAYCEWSADSREAPARVVVAVESVNHDTGGTPTDDDGRRQLGIRRRQADMPGTTIIPFSTGDEAFTACHVTAARRPDCRAYVRVSNVVFSVEFESFGPRDAESSARTLAGTAVRHLTRG